MDRFFYVILIFLAIIIRSISFETLIYADLASKAVSLLLAVYICKDIAIHSIRSFSINIREITLNIKAGIQVMFANTAGMLIIGIIRLGIEKAWEIKERGEAKYCFDTKYGDRKMWKNISKENLEKIKNHMEGDSK